MTKVPIIDQTDKFILKSSEKRKEQGKRAPEKNLGGRKQALPPPGFAGALKI